jgi:hypothetical protein
MERTKLIIAEPVGGYINLIAKLMQPLKKCLNHEIKQEIK